MLQEFKNNPNTLETVETLPCAYGQSVICER